MKTKGSTAWVFTTMVAVVLLWPLAEILRRKRNRRKFRQQSNPLIQ